eukprot:scaffold196_cov113-Cylindrotheca_fusiformis.AAC.1
MITPLRQHQQLIMNVVLSWRAPATSGPLNEDSFDWVFGNPTVFVFLRPLRVFLRCFDECHVDQDLQPRVPITLPSTYLFTVAEIHFVPYSNVNGTIQGVCKVRRIMTWPVKKVNFELRHEVWVKRPIMYYVTSNKVEPSQWYESRARPSFAGKKIDYIS